MKQNNGVTGAVAVEGRGRAWVGGCYLREKEENEEIKWGSS